MECLYEEDKAGGEVVCKVKEAASVFEAEEVVINGFGYGGSSVLVERWLTTPVT
jgi:hypothetical protein